MPKIVFFENRSGVYFWVHEHRKRRRTRFAGRRSDNIPNFLEVDRPPFDLPISITRGVLAAAPTDFAWCRCLLFGSATRFGFLQSALGRRGKIIETACWCLVTHGFRSCYH